jgi:hypothetical protein
MIQIVYSLLPDAHTTSGSCKYQIVRVITNFKYLKRT